MGPFPNVSSEVEIIDCFKARKNMKRKHICKKEETAASCVWGWKKTKQKLN